MVQLKLRLDPSHDAAEVEADRVADAVACRWSGEAAPALPPRLRSHAETPARETPRLPGLEGGGQPLPATERRLFEARLGSDFGAVRLHIGSRADQLTEHFGARALATGTHIAFAQGNYQPGTPAGRRLLAHELVHVVQQRVASPAGLNSAISGPVQGKAPPGRPQFQIDWERREDAARRDRGRGRTGLNPDLGRGRYRDRDRGFFDRNPQAPVSRADTEARLQAEVQRLRPTIPEWYDAENMATFDSNFYGAQGLFDFRGRVMAGWEVNYYFISMALAHQGWDWNETQAIIWTWNTTQEIGLIPGGGEMTDEMWFASHEGFVDEHRRMLADPVREVGSYLPAGPYGPR